MPGYHRSYEQALGGRPPHYAPPPVTLTFDLLTLKVVSESRVTWAPFVPILVLLGLSVLDLGPMYATDVRQHHRLMPPPRGRGHNDTSIATDLLRLLQQQFSNSQKVHQKCLRETVTLLFLVLDKTTSCAAYSARPPQYAQPLQMVT